MYHYLNRRIGRKRDDCRGDENLSFLQRTSFYDIIKMYHITYIIPDNGDLTKWAERGVLLLNTSLTVEENKPASHSKLWAPSQ